MTQASVLPEVQECPIGDTQAALIQEVKSGLTASPKSLAPWMFYDANGSRLFEQITAVEEYYPYALSRSGVTYD